MIGILEIIGTVFATGLYAIVLGVLIAHAPERGEVKLLAFAGAALWGAAIVAVGAAGGFATGAIGQFPAPIIAFIAALALLFGGWFGSQRVKNALLAVPLPLLIALNIGRIGGVFFLILFAEHRLAAPFAPSAGWGDVLTGLLAIPLAVMAAGSAGIRRGWIAAWNLLGAADLVTAITLGALSAPGTPIRVFFAEPGTAAIASMPWVMIPTLLVPLYLLIHLTIAMKIGVSFSRAGKTVEA